MKFYMDIYEEYLSRIASKKELAKKVQLEQSIEKSKRQDTNLNH